MHGHISPQIGRLELGGIDDCFRTIAKSLYAAQAKRAERIGRPVAVGGEALDRSPWFSFFTVYAGDMAWKAASYDARPDLTLRVFSSKVAFGWSALFTDRYAAWLQSSAARFVHEEGVSVGEYESGGSIDTMSLSTNSFVLEAAWYVARGRRAFLSPVPSRHGVCLALAIAAQK